jgi:hypothetical protein
MGSYIILESEVYKDAISRVYKENQGTKDPLKEKLDDLPVPEWIKQETINKCKNLLAIEKLFEERGMVLDEEELEELSRKNKAEWKKTGPALEKQGIGAESLLRNATIALKKEKLRDDIYGPSGEKAVGNSELEQWYKDAYIKYASYSKYCSHPGKNGTSPAPYTDEEKQQEEEKFKEYIEILNSGKKSVEELGKEIAKKERDEQKGDTPEDDKKEEEEVQSSMTETSSPLDKTYLPEEINKELNNLEVGKTTYTKTKDGNTLYLLQKQDISEEAKEKSEDEDERKKLIAEMKSEEYNQYLKDSLAQMDFQVNGRGIAKFPPSMFDTDKKKKKK